MGEAVKHIALKIAAGYVRCSTDDQTATSIPQQMAEIEKWAFANGYKVVEWFKDEGKSGTSFKNRPNFNNLKRIAEGHPNFQFVLVYDESRWGRPMNPRESGYWKMHFDMHGVKVLIINSSSKQGDDIGSMVTEMVESAESSEYSKKLSRSVRRGMLSPQQQKYSRGGTPPYGYKRVAIDLTTGERRELRPGSRNVPKIEKTVLELGDPLEVNTVKRIFELKVAGKGYVGIADILNIENIPCPKRGQKRNKGQKWSGCSVGTILANRTYVGDNVYNRTSFSKFKAAEEGKTDFRKFTNRPKFKNDPSQWQIEHGAFPAIVSEELFEKAQTAIKTSRSNIDVRPNQHLYRSQYLLTGLIKCNHCGFSYHGFRHNKTGNVYYIDGGFTNKGKTVCSYHSIRQDMLEDFVLKSIRECLLTPVMMQKIEEELRRLMNYDGPDWKGARLTEIENQLKDAESKIANLITLAESGKGLTSIGGRIEELEVSKRILVDERERILQPIAERKGDVGNLSRAVRAFLENFEEKMASVPMIEKKELIRMVVEKIIVDREAGQINCYIKPIPTINEFERFEGDKSWVQPVAPTGIEPVFEP